MIMSQVHRDPTIRLFGSTIQLAPNDDVSGEHSSDHNLCYSTGSVSVQSYSDKSLADTTTSSSVLDHLSPISNSPQSTSEEQGGSNESQDNNKPLKKPTEILPCPRCNSSDTKFCYFNNYNMNQPRHFCKDCQRYWTAGGSMRNMVVGAGRRKAKNISSSSSSSSSLHQEMNPDSQSPATINFQAFAPIWPNPAFIPVPVYTSGPTPYWTWVNAGCNNSGELSPNSPLGKHPRENNKGEKRAEESTVLVPKTLRFDDPNEAAMSSIWTTLGIKNRKKSSGCVDSGAFFGGFELRGEEASTEKSTRMLQANPAALSRSLSFHDL